MEYILVTSLDQQKVMSVAPTPVLLFFLSI